GIKGGLNFAQYQTPVFPGGSKSSLTTFNGGFFVDFKFGNISIQPALNYTGKGGKYNETIMLSDDIGNSLGTEKGALEESLYYLELPVNVLYHIPVGIGKVFFGTGPYVAYGISGNAKFSNSDPNGMIPSETHPIHFGNNAYDTKPIQFGADAIAGFEFKNSVLLALNYDLG